jgi:hypothetical protein
MMRRFPAIVLYVVFGLPLLLSALFAISVRSWAFDRSWYERVLTSDRLYELLRDPSFAKDAEEKMAVDGLTLHGPSLVAAAQKDMPVAELKALTKEAIDRGFDYAEGRTGGLPATLDLKPLKSAIASRSAAFAGDYVKGLPVEPKAPAQGDFSYRPQGLAPSVVADRAATELRARAAKMLPDSTAWPPEEATRPKGSGPAWKLDLARLDASLAGLALFSLLVVAGLSLLGARGAVDRLSLAGSFILAPSVIVLLTGAFLATGGYMVQRGLIPTHIQGFASSGAAQALAAYFIGSLGGGTRSLFVTGLIGASLSVFLLSFRKWMRPEEVA